MFGGVGTYDGEPTKLLNDGLCVCCLGGELVDILDVFTSVFGARNDSDDGDVLEVEIAGERIRKVWQR